MASTRKLLLGEAGVRLFEVEEPKSFGRANGFPYRLTTVGPGQPRVSAERSEADNASEPEVTASLADTVVHKVTNSPRH
jgi:hypothetical protein